MSDISENYSLKRHNSFGLDINCRYFYETDSLPELISFFKKGLKPDSRFMILGEGSNVLFTDDYDGTIIHPALRGREIVSEDKNNIVVRVSAGENWDSFVQYCVDNNWSGLENLSLIPGSAGSSPVQNIGAYGVEAKDRIYEVNGFFISNGDHKTFTNKECMFDYRNSIFKQDLKNKYIITSVAFRLDKHPRFVLSYGPVEKEFRKKPEQDLNSLRQTIIEIRQSKLPDPSVLGNAGSFFKNPIITNEIFETLKSNFPAIPFYPSGTEHKKIPAAWLIEQSGWKGVREGNVGSFAGQPLVIVNYGNADGKEIYYFAEKIINSVNEKFEIKLEMEVNIIF
jgi:UDP-N-acetylmuramate dehydrogenase